MTFIHDNTLSFALNFLGANLQHANEANLLLTLGLDTNDLTRLNRVLCVGESASRGCQTWSHECGTGKHEADGAAVDLDSWDGGGVGVDETEVGNWRSIDGLEE
jgi:hypothetical protein